MWGGVIIALDRFSFFLKMVDLFSSAEVGSMVSAEVRCRRQIRAARRWAMTIMKIV